MTSVLRQLATALPQRSSATLRYRMRAAWAAHDTGRRFLPERPCLIQALVLQYLLLRRGDDAAELHIGVAKGEDGTLHAHTWVERDGRVLIRGADSPETYEGFENLGIKMDSVGPPEVSS